MHQIASTYLRVAEKQFGMQMGILEGMGDEQLVFQPKEDIPPILWHYAHSWHGESFVLRTLFNGDTSWAPQEWHEMFGIGSNLAETMPRLPSKDEILKTVGEIRTSLLPFLEALSDEEIAAPFPHWNLAPEGVFPEDLNSPAGFLIGLPTHSGHHQGEMMMLRRIQGGARFV